MKASDQQTMRTSHSHGSGLPGWTLLVLFVAAAGIVFTMAKTGNAAGELTLHYDSPPPSPIESPTPTLTPTPTVSPLPSPTPLVESISPSTGTVGTPQQVSVYGEHFQQGAQVRILWQSNGEAGRAADTPDFVALQTTFMGQKHLVAKVPSNVAKGLYGVQVRNPDGQFSAVKDAAYEVASTNPQETHDLKALNESLWTTPNSLTVGESASIGLTVIRVGGVGGLPPFAVDFYQDSIDPANLIGRGFITGISPNDSASTSAVSWTPPTHGEIKLLAVIDPEGQIAESNENNNRVHRHVDVRYVQPDDTTPPLAQRLLVNGGQNQVSSQNVQLSVEATDPDPNPSGVAKSYYVELHWAAGVGNGGSWIPVKWTSWNNYGDQPHDFELMPNSGLRYLQGWVADGAGNISSKPAVRRVNYIPASDTLLEGEIRVYRQATVAGQCLLVRVEPTEAAMDPDIYVWSPNHQTGDPAAGYSIQGAGEVDQVVIQPTESGVYQIEIVAFTDATFNQTIEVSNSCAVGRSETPTAPTEKAPRQEPSVPVEDEPEGDEVAPETVKQYLSFISITIREERSSGSSTTIYLPSLNR